jgi:prepilin signal peptidase PulO-like enzyme (type II secretory pathway)
LLATSWKGGRFGAKFTFWFLIVFVTLPLTVSLAAKLVSRPHRWQRILMSDQTMVRYVIPAVVAPTAGAAMGAAVAGLLFPVASLLNARSSSGKWEGYESPQSPFDDLPLVARSREELLRRIVIHGPPDLPQPG